MSRRSTFAKAAAAKKAAANKPSSLTTTAAFDLRDQYSTKPPNAEPTTIENPLNKTQKTINYRNLRDDPLARLHARAQIDEAQFQAGRHWQAAYQTAEIAGARGIDPARPHVDGGQIARSGITDAQAYAFRKLERARKAVGIIGEQLLRDVLVLGMTTDMIAKTRGHASDRAKKYYGWHLRQCLNALANEFGFSTTPFDGSLKIGVNRHAG